MRTRDHVAASPASHGAGVDHGPAHVAPGRRTLVETTSRTNEQLLDLMKRYKINNMGALLHESKIEAVPVVAGGEG